MVECAVRPFGSDATALARWRPHRRTILPRPVSPAAPAAAAAADDYHDDDDDDGAADAARGSGSAVSSGWSLSQRPTGRLESPGASGI